MKQKLLFLTFLLFSTSGISQEKVWSNRLEFQISSSFSKVDNFLPGVLWSFGGPRYQIGINYAAGWNTAARVSRNIFLESGLSFIRRKVENANFYNACFHVPEGVGCGSLAIVNTDRRHHLISLPMRIRLQKQLGDKLTGYWSGGLDNYFNLFTIYKGSRYKTKEKYKNYYGHSINTAFGVRYPLAKKWNVDLEVNSRLYEKYRQEEILDGDPESHNTFSFNQVNLMISLNYYL